MNISNGEEITKKTNPSRPASTINNKTKLSNNERFQEDLGAFRRWYHCKALLMNKYINISDD